MEDCAFNQEVDEKSGDGHGSLRHIMSENITPSMSRRLMIVVVDQQFPKGQLVLYVPQHFFSAFQLHLGCSCCRVSRTTFEKNPFASDMKKAAARVHERRAAAPPEGADADEWQAAIRAMIAQGDEDEAARFFTVFAHDYSDLLLRVQSASTLPLTTTTSSPTTSPPPAAVAVIAASTAGSHAEPALDCTRSQPPMTKVQLGDEMRLVALPDSCSFEQALLIMRAAHGVPSHVQLRTTYVDSDNDRVTISSTVTLTLIFHAYVFHARC